MGEEIKGWVIYKITSPNNRIYIGKTFQWKVRYNSYKIRYGINQPLLNRSLLKYGFLSHKVDVIESFVSDKNWASGKEMFWIRTYMSNRCKYPEQNGLNLTDGGEGTCGYKKTKQQIDNHRKAMIGKPSPKRGIPLSEEIKLKISKKLSGRTGNTKGMKNLMSAQGKENVRMANIGNKYALGRKRTDETKEKLSISHMGLSNNKKSVVYYNKNGVMQEYSTIKSLGEEIGLTPTMIYHYLKGRVKNPKHKIEYLHP